MKVQTVYGPVQDDIALVEATIDLIKRVELAPLAQMLEHVLGAGGKRIRPGLALLGGTFGTYDLDRLVQSGDPKAVAAALARIKAAREAVA